MRGHKADARSDIFAFGAVLYEMLSGRRAFEGATPADTASAILRKILRTYLRAIARYRLLSITLCAIAWRRIPRNVSSLPVICLSHLHSLSSISDSGAAAAADLPTKRSSRPVRWLLGSLALALVAAGAWQLSPGVSRENLLQRRLSSGA